MKILYIAAYSNSVSCRIHDCVSCNLKRTIRSNALVEIGTSANCGLLNPRIAFTSLSFVRTIPVNSASTMRFHVHERWIKKRLYRRSMKRWRRWYTVCIYTYLSTFKVWTSRPSLGETRAHESRDVSPVSSSWPYREVYLARFGLFSTVQVCKIETNVLLEHLSRIL